MRLLSKRSLLGSTCGIRVRLHRLECLSGAGCLRCTRRGLRGVDGWSFLFAHENRISQSAMESCIGAHEQGGLGGDLDL